MRVLVDRDRCTGLGMCEAAAPDYFEIQEDGSLRLLVERACDAHKALLDEAVASCPAEALSIIED